MDAVAMVKTLVPGALDTLADDRIVDRVRERLSFMARAIRLQDRRERGLPAQADPGVSGRRRGAA
jgi:hypothetical protein